MFSLALSLLDSPTPSISQEASFYPPLSSLSYITNSEYGTFGGIFSAPAREATENLSGSYDYCTMPHPSPESYQSPPPVYNHSIDAQLVYVEYMQRHQRRTAYNILPGGEDQRYECDDVNPYLYAGPTDEDLSRSPLPVYAQTYTDASNPFVASYVNGTCQYPQLTIGGVLDGYRHGRDLWGVYGEKMGLLPTSPKAPAVWFRSSSSALTQDSAGAVLRGIWPDYRGSLPLHQQAAAVDTVNEGFSCAARSQLLSIIQSSDEWNQHLAITQPLRSRLGTLFDANSSDWMSTFDHFADNFQARLCNGYRLPCSRSDPSACATTADADEVFRAGDWEWNYWWNQNRNASQYIQLVEGLFLREIVGRLEATAQGSLDRVYTHNFVHDGDLGPILGALGIEQLRWPGMGSNIAFEVWQTSDSQSFARVLYSGHALRTAHGTLDWVPLTDVVDRLKAHVPDDIIAMCKV
ncbi:histidine acid phosphatase [Penicillium lagena]|uniref:histidine acid phosphatase n=1 Tax=Penicillium lagena TaxID=94218 RepID=UPI00253F7011|nr:histidine acid phosphatase [Penicillium lagena]KAJ5626305.1 histidine acid phosphatase [Penicillium lagena]